MTRLGFGLSGLLLVLAGAPFACTSSHASSPIVAADAGTPPSEVDADSDVEIPFESDGTSGAPCRTAADCKGKNPKCLTSLGKGEFIGGYCTSQCDPSKNDSRDRNTSCPGAAAVCERTQGACFAGCTDKQGARPCRADYLCTYQGTGSICLPASYSECDLSKRGSCGSGKVCIIAGLDPVGFCAPGCDIFEQACGGVAADAGADTGPPKQGCYPNALGEGHCADVKTAGADGDDCLYVNDCAPGLSCNDEGASRVCRPLCGGPNDAPCNNGKTCVDLSSEAAVSVAGVCAG
jgi:hypothetical protein